MSEHAEPCVIPNCQTHVAKNAGTISVACGGVTAVLNPPPSALGISAEREVSRLLAELAEARAESSRAWGRAMSLEATNAILSARGGEVRMSLSQWISVKDRLPPLRVHGSRQPAPYVLACDAKGRMSVGYAAEHSSGHIWTFAKPIGEPTHWQPLPDRPTDREEGT